MKVIPLDLSLFGLSQGSLSQRGALLNDQRQYKFNPLDRAGERETSVHCGEEINSSDMGAVKHTLMGSLQPGEVLRMQVEWLCIQEK